MHMLKDVFYSWMLIYKEKRAKNTMNRTISAIPAQCKRCGELFDLSYDLENISEERLLIELVRATKNPRSALCWECRNNGR